MAHLLSIMINKQYLCRLLQHDLAGECGVAAPCHLTDDNVVKVAEAQASSISIIRFCLAAKAAVPKKNRFVRCFSSSFLLSAHFFGNDLITTVMIYEA